MGLLKRIKRITTARIEAFLTSVEDPEVIFPQLIREMEEQIRHATEAEAKAMAAVKSAERDLAAVKERSERLQSGAELALDKGDDATAREAVASQIDLEADQQRKQESLDRARQAMENARSSRQQVQAQLDELRAKKDEILTRARVAKNEKKIQRTVHGRTDSSQSILDTVSRLESQIEEEEAELEVQRDMGQGGSKPSLDRRLDDLERDSEIEKRLAALKQRAQGGDEG